MNSFLHALRRSRNLLILPMIAGSLLMRLDAADFYWDAETAVEGNQNGSGEWNSAGSLLNWTSIPAQTGSTNLPWVNANDSVAHLGAADGYTNAGTGGELTLAENITLNQLRMGPQAGAYSILPGIGNHSLIFSGTAPVLHSGSSNSLTLQAGWQAAGGLVKTGSGRVIFTAPAGSSTGSGSLAIQQGTVQLGAANTLPTNMSVILGDQTTAGNLEVDASQTLAGLSFQCRAAAATNSITIAAGATLTVNGSMITGIVDGTATGGSTLATIQGGGSLVVNNATGSFIVSSGTKVASTPIDISSLDLSGLAAFTATVNRFDVGRATNAAGTFQGSSGTGGRPQGSLTLAATNTITANIFVVGAGNQTVTTSTLNLGQENFINTNTLVLGNARANGTLSFNIGLDNPTLVLRGSTGGSSRTNVFLGDSRNTSSVGGVGGSSQPNGIMNLTGGTVDLMIDTLRIGIGGTNSGGATPAFGRGQGTFSFDGADSIVDINTLHIGVADNVNNSNPTATNPYLSASGQFNMGGGTLIINTGMTLARSEDALEGQHQMTQGTFTMTNGHLQVGSAVTSASIILGDHSRDGIGMSTAVLNLHGGTASLFGDIVRGAGLTTGTLSLDGTALNLNGGSIGSAALPITLNLQSGGLANVGEINGGGPLTKVGTGTLILSGTNTYTGATGVNAGRLLVTSAAAMQSTSGLTVGGSGTFDFISGSGSTLTLPALTLNNGASLGMEMGSSTGSITIQPAAVVSTDAAAVVNIRLHTIHGQATPTSSLLLSAPGGGLTGNGATYALEAVYNATHFNVALQATDTQLTATTTAATALANAYWLGGFAGDNDAWAVSNGSTQSNWVTNADGTGSTGLVPGAGTNVFFSATGASLPATTELGASMDILSLTVNSATPLTLNSPAHRLTIHGDTAITVSAGAGAVTLNTMLDLEGTAPIISVDNTGGLTLAGEISGTGGLTKTGTGTLTLGAAVNLYSGRTSILGGTLAVRSEAALGGTQENLVADYLLLNGGTLRALESFAIADARRGITLGNGGGTFQVDSGKTLKIDSLITGTAALNKTGAGTLELTAANPYNGTTTIFAGTLALTGGDNRLPATSLILFSDLRTDPVGDSILDLGGNSQTLAALQFTSEKPALSPLPPTIPHLVTITNGSLTVNNTTSVMAFLARSQVQPLTVDMSGLTAYTHNGGTQEFSIGLTGGSHTASGITPVATLSLAQTSSIIAGSLVMGKDVGSSGGGLSRLYLGQTTTLRVNTISMGATRSSSEISFAPGLINPSITIRGNNGTSPVNTWTMGRLDHYNNALWSNTADFSAGSLNALVTTLNVGEVAQRAGTLDASFIMGAGNMTITTLNIGRVAGGNDGDPVVSRIRTVNSTFELNGPGTVQVANVVMAINVATSDLGSTSANGTLTVRDGNFNVGTGGINLARSDNAGIHTATGTLNLFGGVLSTQGNIFKHSTGSGTATAEVVLNGGTLNMNGKDIGTVARPVDTLTLQAGEMQNVREINGGAAITKSGNSTDILRLTGTHTYTGSTTVAGGSLLVNGSHTGGGTYTVQTGATLGGSGSLVLASGSSVTIAAGATLSVGDGTLGGQTLQIETANLGQVTFTDSSSILTLDLFSRIGTDSSDLLAVQGSILLNEAQLVITDVNGIASTFVYEDSWRIFDWSNVSSLDLGSGSNVFTIDPLLNLPALTGGLTWDLSDLYIGGTISVVPEPGRAALLLIALSIGFFRRRR
jgi:autotransporter-associated beta strand protein